MLVGDKRRKFQLLKFSKAARDVFALLRASGNDPDPLLKSFIAALVDSQVLSGNFPLFDVIQMRRIDTAANSVVNWIGNFSNGLLVSSPTFIAFDGVLGDGALEEINTQYNPTVDGVNVSQNDIQVGSWVVDNLDAAAGRRLLDTSDALIRLFQFTTPEIRGRLNSVVTTNHQANLFLDDKLYSLKRVGAANQIVIEDKVENSVAQASSALSNADIIELATINAKTGCFYATKAVGFDHDNWFDNLKIYMDGVATLQ